MDLAQRVSIGQHQLPMTRAGFGCAPIGNFPDAVSDQAAHAALEAAWDAGLRYFDTSPWYGLGLSERRLGAFLRDKPREEFVISTKVGRILGPWTTPQYERRHRGASVDPPDFEARFDYSYDGVVRAWEDSLQRLGLARVDLLLIHDLDRIYFPHGADYDAHLAQLVTGGYQALRDLRADGKIKAIGCGVNIPGQIPQFLDLFDLDFFLVAGPYTLLEQTTLDTELDRCRLSGVSLVIGAAFRYGILGDGHEGLYRERPSGLGRGRAAEGEADRAGLREARGAAGGGRNPVPVRPSLRAVGPLRRHRRRPGPPDGGQPEAPGARRTVGNAASRGPHRSKCPDARWYLIGSTGTQSKGTR